MAEANIKRAVFINTLFITFQTVIDKFIFFIINMLIARYLDTSLFGEYVTSLAYATFYSTFIDIGIRSALIRSINKDEANKDEHITNAFLLESMLSVVIYSAMAFSLFFMNYPPTVSYLILIFGFVRIGNEFMNLFYSIYAVQERFFVQAVNNSLFSFTLLISTLIVIFLGMNTLSFAYTRLIIVALFICFLAYFASKETKFRFRLKSFKAFLHQTYHFGLSSIYENLTQRTNIIILSYMHGTLYSGFFSNAYMIFTTLYFIPENLNRVLMIHLYKYSYNDDPGRFQFAFDVYSKVFNIISIGISLLLFIFASEIITLIYGKNYLPAAQILKIASLAIPLLFNVSGILLTAIDRQYVVTTCQKYSLAVNIVSNLVLIYFFKGEGAAFATVITFLTLSILYKIALAKYTRVNHAYSLKIKSVIIIIAVCLTFFKYSIPNINFIFSGLIIFILYCILVYILVINKKDLDIAREIFGRFVPVKKYILFG